MGRGEAALQEDGWNVGDEGSSSGELGGMCRGESALREDMWGVGDEGSNVGELDSMGRGERGWIVAQGK